MWVLYTDEQREEILKKIKERFRNTLSAVSEQEK